MQIHRLKKLFFVFVSFFIATEVFATSVVQSEFEMLLPRSFQQNLIEQQWTDLQKYEFNLSWMLPDQTFETPDVKVLLTGLKLDLHTRLQKPAISPGGDTVILESRGLEANLLLQSVSIDQWIEREVGGVIGRFRVQARCEGVQLHMIPGKAQLTMQLSPEFDGPLLRAHVDDANLTWAPDAWEIQSLNCTGAQGFEDIVRAEIYKRTGDASIVTSRKAELLQYARDYVNSHVIDLSTPRNLITARPDIEVSMRVTNFIGGTKSAVIRGIVRVDFTQLRNGDVISLHLGNQSVGSSSNTLVRIPEEFVLAVAKQAYAGNTWVAKVYSNEIPGFQSLMKSRFTQFFVWRELMKYPKSARFLFEVYSPKNVSITGKNLNYEVKAPLFAKMFAPREGQYVPFMNFSVPLTSDVKLSLKSGTVTAKFTDVRIGLQESWDPGYVAKYSPARTFAAEKIRSRIESSVQNKSLDYQLPSIPVSDDISFIVQRAEPTKSGDLILYLVEPGKQGPTPK